MPHEHLNNEEFFTQLTNLFEHNRKKGHGTVYLTQKRVAATSDKNVNLATKVIDDPLWDTHPESPLPVVIRASNNKSTTGTDPKREDIDKIRLSTVVQPEQIDAFYARYAEVCKAGMGALKKRDRTKRKKDKKKKKGAATETKA
ncbi:signal recognition particle 14kD protein-domain-containing protein [Dendryphion nanum]|uniref:Signal recognition particle subunit SRP14 n=1 Tax=Dendryphion nanum TaxID=256645 RepID=A0A9P9IGU8_9PLEO|nr:signal recognition particle 14kD protein-domain-containing protein [Dendryphion nanum]